jgi:hypothetical protein
VVLPGDPDARREWESIVGESAAKPADFVRALLDKDRGRVAWLYLVLAELDRAHLQYAMGTRAVHLEKLAEVARQAAPEWIIDERPFWRPAFDWSLALSLVDVDNGAPRGSEAFWREVFRGEDLDRFNVKRGEALTSGTLLDILFDEPFTARARWEVFAIGQRMPGVEADLPDAGRALRAARRHPALALMLDRLRIDDVRLRVSLHRASSRVTSQDEMGSRGDLATWQSILAVVERGALTGGLDSKETARALGELAALPLDDTRDEVTAWLLDTFLPRLTSRPGAPHGPEPVLIEMMSGALTAAGPARRKPFTWEDLSYVVGTREALAARMRQAREAQGTLTLDAAALAWEIARSGKGDVAGLSASLRESPFHPAAADQAERLERQSKRRDTEELRREARRAAVLIVNHLLPALAYAPHLAATETPQLGADIAFRHAFGTREEASASPRLRAWHIARGAAQRGTGWNLHGSFLLLDLALSSWYLRHNVEPPLASPVFDELDVAAFAQVPALTRTAGASHLGLGAAVSAVERGRQRARESVDLPALDDLLRSSGVDAWRRREIRFVSASVEEAAAALSYAEAWRLGGAPGMLSPRASLDACGCMGRTPHATSLLAGRRSAGLVGAGSVDVQLRVAAFLYARGLPDDLFGEVTAGVLTEVLEHTRAVRPDDFRALAGAAAAFTDDRLEEHLLVLVGDGTLARPNQTENREH